MEIIKLILFFNICDMSIIKIHDNNNIYIRMEGFKVSKFFALPRKT